MVEWGVVPAVVEVPEPRAGVGQALVRVRAAALNPVDIAIASGRFYMPVPEPPFVAGAEAVGERRTGDRVALRHEDPRMSVWCPVAARHVAEA